MVDTTCEEEPRKIDHITAYLAKLGKSTKEIALEGRNNLDDIKNGVIGLYEFTPEIMRSLAMDAGFTSLVKKENGGIVDPLGDDIFDYSPSNSQRLGNTKETVSKFFEKYPGAEEFGGLMKGVIPVYVAMIGTIMI